MPRARTSSGERPRSTSPRRSSGNSSKARSVSGSSVGSGKARAAPFQLIGTGTAPGDEVPSDSPGSLDFSPDDVRQVATIGSVPKVKMQPRKLEDSFPGQSSSSSTGQQIPGSLIQPTSLVNLDVGQCPLCRRQGFDSGVQIYPCSPLTWLWRLILTQLLSLTRLLTLSLDLA